MSNATPLISMKPQQSNESRNLIRNIYICKNIAHHHRTVNIFRTCFFIERGLYLFILDIKGKIEEAVALCAHFYRQFANILFSYLWLSMNLVFLGQLKRHKIHLNSRRSHHSKNIFVNKFDERLYSVRHRWLWKPAKQENSTVSQCRSISYSWRFNFCTLIFKSYWIERLTANRAWSATKTTLANNRVFCANLFFCVLNRWLLLQTLSQCFSLLKILSTTNTVQC